MSSVENLIKSSIYFIVLIIAHLSYYTKAFVEYSQVPDFLIKGLTFLFLFDTATGIAAARKLKKKNKKIKISSTIGIRGIIYKMTMLLVILGAASFMKFTKIDGDSFIITVFSLMMVFEAYSILGNVRTYKTGKKKDEYDTVTLLLDAVMKRFRKLIRVLLNTIAGEDIVKDKLEAEETEVETEEETKG
jgi:hypothetical protein